MDVSGDRDQVRSRSLIGQFGNLTLVSIAAISQQKTSRHKVDPPSIPLLFLPVLLPCLISRGSASGIYQYGSLAGNIPNSRGNFDGKVNSTFCVHVLTKRL